MAGLLRSAVGRAVAAPRPCLLRARGLSARATPVVFTQDGAEHDAEISAWQKHQDACKQPSPAEAARTLLAASLQSATLCTLSSAAATKGFPFGAAVPYAVDDQGRVVCAMSSLSLHMACAPPLRLPQVTLLHVQQRPCSPAPAHVPAAAHCSSTPPPHPRLPCSLFRTPPNSPPLLRDLRADPRCSLHITATGFESLADARCCITGRLCELTDAADAEAACTTYKAAHPDHFWARAEPLAALRVARARRTARRYRCRAARGAKG